MAEKRKKNDYIITNCVMIEDVFLPLFLNDLHDVLPQRYNILSGNKRILNSNRMQFEKNTMGIDKYFDRTSLK